MFSVIIPLFNKSQYIEKCLKSVYDQSFTEFEIIVVNDGSTDDSLEKTKSFKDAKLHSLKIIDQVNSGVSTARNEGVKASTYNYIAFLDADDWWEPSYLKNMKSLIEEYPDAGIYGSNYYIVKNKRKQIATIGVDQTFSKGIINYFQTYAKTLCMPLWTGATIISKNIFESENGFNPKLNLGEDFDLWIRVALKYPVVFLNLPLANYNQDVDSTGRAVGNLHNPENHILWNLEYLKETEKVNHDLKQLLDNLRVYSLFPYFLDKSYLTITQQELKKVDWSKQPLKEKYRYNSPIIFLKFLWSIQLSSSKLKQFLIRKIGE
jgi:glycosyltransferase involved in cell wall biosynthesis